MILVVVDWEDSRQPNPSWQFLDDLDCGDVVRCRSVGWLVRDDEAIVLAPNLGDLGASTQVSGFITIPRRCVTSMRQVGDGLTSDPVPSSHPETGPKQPADGFQLR